MRDSGDFCSMDKKNAVLQNYISNLQIDVSMADYTHCWKDWRVLDYVPDYNKFYYIIEGEGWLKIRDKEFYPLPGQLILMPAGVIQSYSSINDNTFKKYWCHFSAKTGNINIFDKIRLPCFIQVIDGDKVEQLFKDLVHCYKIHDLTASIRMKALLLEIIAYYIEHADGESMQFSSTPANEKLNSVMNYINEHLSDNITIERLAAIAHFNPRYFIRFFKQNIGSTPIHYINQVRMEKAKNLLSTSRMNVTEVADAIGFNDLFHFSKAFKTHTGYTPTEFKKYLVQRE